jgi:uncharacterized protein
MSSAPATDPLAPINLQGPRVSTIIVQSVPPDRVQNFLECQRGLTQAAEGFPGYKGSELYPPADDKSQEWVGIVHFIDAESLERWINSPVRADWVKKLRAEIGDFRLKTLPSGFGAWFAGLETGPDGGPPPSWKIAMTVLLGLYPTVMVLALVVGRFLSPLGLAFAMLISNILSVSLTQWVVIPPIMKVLGPWLRANGPDQKLLSFGGLILLWLLIIGIALAFRTVAG